MLKLDGKAYGPAATPLSFFLQHPSSPSALLGFCDTSSVFPTHPCSQTAAAPFLLEGRTREEEIELLALPLLSTIFLEGSFSLVDGLHCPPHSCLFL